MVLCVLVVLTGLLENPYFKYKKGCLGWTQHLLAATSSPAAVKEILHPSTPFFRTKGESVALETVATRNTPTGILSNTSAFEPLHSSKAGTFCLFLHFENFCVSSLPALICCPHLQPSYTPRQTGPSDHVGGFP